MAFSPDDLSGLVQWNRADDITGLNDGEDVTTWTAAAGSDFTEATNPPIWKDSIINGLPVVRFAVNKGLRRSRLYTDDAFTIFAVGANVTNKDRLNFLSQHDGTAATGRTFFLHTNQTTDNDKLRLFFNNGSSFDAVSSTVAWETAAHLVATYSDGSGNSGVRVDGGSEEDSVTGQTWTPLNTNLTLNGDSSDFANGGAWDLGELICYNRKLDESEFVDVWGYLNRWMVATHLMWAGAVT